LIILIKIKIIESIKYVRMRARVTHKSINKKVHKYETIHFP